MFLTEMTLGQALRRELRQRQVELDSWIKGLAALGLIAVVFSLFFSSEGFSGTSSEALSIRLSHHNNSLAFLIGAVFCAIMAGKLASAGQKNCCFAFGGNRLANHLANMTEMAVTAAAVALGLLCVLAAVRLLAALLYGPLLLAPGYHVPLGALLAYGLRSFGWLLLASTAAYLAVTLQSRWRFAAPAGLLLLILGGMLGIWEPLALFYAGEVSLALFMLKALLTAAALFAWAAYAGRALEVRK